PGVAPAFPAPEPPGAPEPIIPLDRPVAASPASGAEQPRPRRRSITQPLPVINMSPPEPAGVRERPIPVPPPAPPDAVTAQHRPVPIAPESPGGAPPASPPRAMEVAPPPIPAAPPAPSPAALPGSE